MGKLFVASFIMATLCVLSFDEVSGQTKSCRSIVSDLNKREILGISTCTKSMRSQFKNVRDKIAKSSCIMKCVLRNEKILTEDGEFNRENVEAFVTREFPIEYHSKIRDLINPCVETHGKNLDNNEEFCKSYEPVIKCFSSKLPSFCK